MTVDDYKTNLTDHGNDANMNCVRAGGASDSSAYPPVINLTKQADVAKVDIDRSGGASDSSAYPPDTCFLETYYQSIIKELNDSGFNDANKPYVSYMLKRVSYAHLQPYLAFIAKHSHSLSKSVYLAHESLTLDRRFQSIILKYIGAAEMQFRAQYAACMRLVSGEFSLYDSQFFLNENSYEGTIKIIKKEIKNRCEKNRVFNQIYVKNDNYLPIEYAIECSTLGSLTRLYANTKSSTVKTLVAESFGVNKAKFSKWFHCISDVRNICAHFEYYITRNVIPSTPVPIPGLSADNTKPFYIVLLLAKLLSGDIMLESERFTYPYMLWLDIKTWLDTIPKNLQQALQIPENALDLIDRASSGQVRMCEYVNWPHKDR